MIRRALIRKPSIARVIIAKRLGASIVRSKYSENVYLIGSAAVRRATPQSDLDIIVENCRSPAARSKIWGLVVEYQARFGLQIDVAFVGNIQEWLGGKAVLIAGGSAK